MLSRPHDSYRQLIDALNSRILVLDGAMGTAIQGMNLTAKDFGGESLEGCNENLVLTRPDAIQSIHEDYLNSGCDIVETNTFGATPFVLGEYQLSHKAVEINLAAAQLARRATAKYSTPAQPRFVAGSIGPTTKAMSVTGGISFEELQEQYLVQARALWQGGVDFLLFETTQDTRNLKAGLSAIDLLEAEIGEKIPIAVSVTIEPMGTMLAGQSVEALYAALAHKDLLYIGLNCATGPEFMTDHIRSLHRISKFRIACVPNAGLPDENGCYLESPSMISAVLSRFIEAGWINLLGGCCGTTAGHIEALHLLAEGKKPRHAEIPGRSYLSGVDYLEITDELRPVIVGERTNVIGSKKFKELICAEKFDEASEIARAQIKTGAQIVDVCMANPDRNELEDMRKFMGAALQKVRAPIMIDSTDEKVIELALTYCQGKAIINSINLEDGEERFEKVIPLAKRYGAALVVGCIDDDPQQGMGVTSDRKLDIAERSYALLTEKYGVAPEDIYWDPLVFPCATGDEQYVGSAKHTIEGVRKIKQRFPNTKTVLGISNVSFGLPAAGREVLNSVFLYHCVQAGLDLAIVNAEKLERYASIPDEEKLLADRLLFNEGEDPVGNFANHFRVRKVKAPKDKNLVPLNDRLAAYIVEGSKDGLVEDLNEALKTMVPLDIINGPLMKGMDEVGRLFNDNKLIVAEVLQSAEAMKASVAHLEPFMDKNTSASRGKIVLATVKGDVHDIGKNLVDIILSNNGFHVVNLGIKIPPEQLIAAIREHEPDIVGLSGLLVKSAQQMVVTAEDFTKSGVDTPMLVGGAALSQKFVDTRIAKAYRGTVAYASDAMSGLDLAKTIVDPQAFHTFKQSLEARRAAEGQKESVIFNVAPQVISEKRSEAVKEIGDLPRAPDFERHVLKNTPIDQIWDYVNPLMLYGRHLGVPGKLARTLDQLSDRPDLQREIQSSHPKVFQIWETVESLKREFRNSPVLQTKAVYQFFDARSKGNDLIILSQGKEVASFRFPRQKKENGLCLSDYTSPIRPDNIVLFAVSVGSGVREVSDEMKNRGDYLKSHALQVLALESAEGYAEWLHTQIRRMWGFPDSLETTMMQRFQAKYRGKRYSFGYPACPRLDDQRILWDLIRPDDIGIELTDGFMMDPEASVSALVFHHPDASYFSVGTDEGGRE